MTGLAIEAAPSNDATDARDFSEDEEAFFVAGVDSDVPSDLVDASNGGLQFNNITAFRPVRSADPEPFERLPSSHLVHPSLAKVPQDDRILLLFDLNGVLVHHTFNGRKHAHHLRPGVKHLRRLLPHFRLGVYSSATHRTVLRAVSRINEDLGDAKVGVAREDAGLAQKHAEHTMLPAGTREFHGSAAGVTTMRSTMTTSEQGIFEVILCRNHCVLAKDVGISRDGSKDWDTVKPLGQYFDDLSRVVLIDDSAHKSLPEEARNMLVVPAWVGPRPDHLDTRATTRDKDTVIQSLVDTLLATLGSKTDGKLVLESNNTTIVPCVTPHGANETSSVDVRNFVPTISRQLALLAPVLHTTQPVPPQPPSHQPVAAIPPRFDLREQAQPDLFQARQAAPPLLPIQDHRIGEHAAESWSAKILPVQVPAPVGSGHPGSLTSLDALVLSTVATMDGDAMQASCDAQSGSGATMFDINTLLTHRCKAAFQAILANSAKSTVTRLEEAGDVVILTQGDHHGRRYGLAKGAEELFAAAAGRLAEIEAEEVQLQKQYVGGGGGGGEGTGSGEAASAGEHQTIQKNKGNKVKRSKKAMLAAKAARNPEKDAAVAEEMIRCALAELHHRKGVAKDRLEASVIDNLKTVPLMKSTLMANGKQTAKKQANAALRRIVRKSIDVACAEGKLHTVGLLSGGSCPPPLLNVRCPLGRPHPPVTNALLSDAVDDIICTLTGGSYRQHRLAQQTTSPRSSHLHLSQKASGGSVTVQQGGRGGGALEGHVLSKSGIVGSEEGILPFFEDRGSLAASAPFKTASVPSSGMVAVDAARAAVGNSELGADVKEVFVQGQLKRDGGVVKLSKAQRQMQEFGIDPATGEFALSELKRLKRERIVEARKERKERKRRLREQREAAQTAALFRSILEHDGKAGDEQGIDIDPNDDAGADVADVDELPIAGDEDEGTAIDKEQEQLGDAACVLPTSLPSDDGFTALHHEILAFARAAAPTRAEVAEVRAAVGAVDVAAKAVWPEARTVLFGSQATGLALPGGDLDIVILGVGPQLRKAGTGFSIRQRRVLAGHLEDLLDALTESHVILGKAQIIGARIPIIKCTIRAPGCHAPLPIDISIGTANGAEAVDFIRRQVIDVPPLRPLTLVVKALLRDRGLNEVFTGGLGSYAVVNMVLAHLQSEGYDPDVSPGLRERASQHANQGEEGARRTRKRKIVFLEEDSDDAISTDDVRMLEVFVDVDGGGKIATSSSHGQCHVSDGAGSEDAIVGDSLHAGDVGETIEFLERLTDGGGVYDTASIPGSDAQREFLHAPKPPNATTTRKVQTDLGVLLWGFLERYSSAFDYKKHAISIRRGGTVSKGKWKAKARPWLLACEDPQEPGKDICAGSFAIKEVIREFDAAAAIVAEASEDVEANLMAQRLAMATAAAAAAVNGAGTEGHAVSNDNSYTESPASSVLGLLMDVECAVGRGRAAVAARRALEAKAEEARAVLAKQRVSLQPPSWQLPRAKRRKVGKTAQQNREHGLVGQKQAVMSAGAASGKKRKKKKPPPPPPQQDQEQDQEQQHSKKNQKKRKQSAIASVGGGDGRTSASSTKVRGNKKVRAVEAQWQSNRGQFLGDSDDDGYHAIIKGANTGGHGERSSAATVSATSTKKKKVKKSIGKNKGNKNTQGGQTKGGGVKKKSKQRKRRSAVVVADVANDVGGGKKTTPKGAKRKASAGVRKKKGQG